MAWRSKVHLAQRQTRKDDNVLTSFEKNRLCRNFCFEEENSRSCCGKDYADDGGRPFALRIHEHAWSPKRGIVAGLQRSRRRSHAVDGALKAFLKAPFRRLRAQSSTSKERGAAQAALQKRYVIIAAFDGDICTQMACKGKVQNDGLQDDLASMCSFRRRGRTCACTMTDPPLPSSKRG